MRILLVSNLFPPEYVGGYELIAYELACRFAGAGHDVAVATSPLINHPDELAEHPFAIHRVLEYGNLPLDQVKSDSLAFRNHCVNLANISALRLVVDTFRPDRLLLCNVHGLGAPGIIFFFYKLGFQTSIYLGDNVFQGNDVNTRDAFYRLFGARPAIEALNLLAVSEGVYHETCNSAGVKLREPLYVPGWVADDLPLLPPRGGVEDTRFIFSSRIAEHKGITILLDAVRLLVERGECKFSVDLYGPGKVPDILQRVHAEGLSGYIRYGGLLERNEMIARFASYDALTFPTWPREPLGLVPFEAAAQGCIPIMTAQAGAAEWLPTGDCIKIKRTPEGLAGGMQRVIHMPPEERRIMRQAISLNTRRFFSSNTWFPRIEQVTENLPRSAPRITAQTMRDAMFAITRMWRG